MIYDSHGLPVSGRTVNTEGLYFKAQEENTLRGLLNEPTLSHLSENWKLKYNAFPQDAEFEYSLMAVFKEKRRLDELTDEEKIDTMNVIIEMLKNYDFVVFNGHSMSSIPSIAHFHGFINPIGRIKLRELQYEGN